jgi:hypothetical protein
MIHVRTSDLRMTTKLFPRSFYWLFLNKNELKWRSASAIYCENITHTGKNGRIRSTARIRLHSLSMSHQFKEQRTITSLIIASGWLNLSRARFCSKHFGFHVSVSFHQCSILIFILLLLLSEGQAGPSAETFIQSNSFGHRGTLHRKVRLFNTNLQKESRNRSAATRKALAYFPSQNGQHYRSTTHNAHVSTALISSSNYLLVIILLLSTSMKN